MGLVVNQPHIRIRQLPGKWRALDYYDGDLEPFVLSKGSGDFRNDDKIRIASDFVGRDAVELQETDTLAR